MKIDSSTNAFPPVINSDGLSKREYIAIQMLTGLLAGCDENYNYGGDYDKAVKEAVQLADTLIAELNNETH
jgi:hypothetical protein